MDERLRKEVKKMNINEITFGMNPSEKEIYFNHQEKRHAEEQAELEQEKARMHDYKSWLIGGILKNTDNFSEEDLRKFTIRKLERIFDYC